MDEVRYHYSGLGAGHLTLAYKVSGDRNSNVRKVTFGYAFCSPKDRFSKKDVSRTVSKTRWNPETRKVEVLETETVVTPGGRTKALSRFNSEPVTLTVNVADSKSALVEVISTMIEYCYEHAPSWRNKVKHHVSRKGNHSLSIDGFTVRFAEKGSEYLLQLETPWGDTETV